MAKNGPNWRWTGRGQKMAENFRPRGGQKWLNFNWILELFDYLIFWVFRILEWTNENHFLNYPIRMRFLQNVPESLLLISLWNCPPTPCLSSSSALTRSWKFGFNPWAPKKELLPYCSRSFLGVPLRIETDSYESPMIADSKNINILHIDLGKMVFQTFSKFLQFSKN